MKRYGMAAMVGVACATCFAQAQAWAAEATEAEVTAVGQAAILNSDQASARDKAIDDALRKAVEQAVGTMVSSETVTENYQVLSDKIYSKAKGYVKNYRILSEGKEDGGVYSVKVQAKVATGNLENDVEGILAVLRAKNMPRVLVMISEQNIGQPQPAFWWGGQQGSAPVVANTAVSLDAVENSFIKEWMAKGIIFVDRQAIMGKIKVGAPVTSTAAPNDQAVKEFAGNTGAEVVVYGQAVATDAGTVMGTQMHSLRANVSLKALNLDTGVIMGTSVVSQVANHIDPTTGGTKALQAAGKKASEELLQQILAKWESEVAGASTVKLMITNVKSNKELKALKRFIEDEVRGVQAVRQREFRKKTAELEIDIKGSVQALVDELEAKALPGFKLDVTDQTANTITAEMK